MVNIICDICKKRPADKHFKVKKKVRTFPYAKREWVQIDVCEDCYQKLLASKN